MMTFGPIDTFAWLPRQTPGSRKCPHLSSFSSRPPDTPMRMLMDAHGSNFMTKAPHPCCWSPHLVKSPGHPGPDYLCGKMGFRGLAILDFQQLPKILREVSSTCPKSLDVTEGDRRVSAPHTMKPTSAEKLSVTKQAASSSSGALAGPVPLAETNYAYARRSSAASRLARDYRGGPRPARQIAGDWVIVIDPPLVSFRPQALPQR